MALVPWRYKNPYRQQPLSGVTSGNLDCQLTLGDTTITLRQDFSQPINLQHNTGNKLWDGAYILSQWLLSRSPPISGKRILELGAGCGLVSIVAWSQGARVVATDIASATDGLRCNILRNVEKIDPSRAHDISVLPLVWGDTQLPGESPTGSFDLILGSEILYLKDQHLNLLRTIKAFSSPTTCTYLLYKHRNLSEIDFILLAREAGFKVKKVPTTTLDPEFQNDGYTLILLVLDSRTTNPQDCGST